MSLPRRCGLGVRPGGQSPCPRCEEEGASCAALAPANEARSQCRLGEAGASAGRARSLKAPWSKWSESPAAPLPQRAGDSWQGCRGGAVCLEQEKPGVLAAEGKGLALGPAPRQSPRDLLVTCRAGFGTRERDCGDLLREDWLSVPGSLTPQCHPPGLSASPCIPPADLMVSFQIGT